MVRDLQPFKDAHAKLRWPVYTCDMCDFWSDINPGDMLALFLNFLQAFFELFVFLGAWKQFPARTACFGCLAQIRAYMYIDAQIRFFRFAFGFAFAEPNNYFMSQG